MRSPKVTVLMSVYNGGAYLVPAVESILGQDFTDFEFLIIDDGSTEPLNEIMGSFNDTRIKIIRQENMGLPSALNKGLILSRGVYVARMDADDISEPGRLAAQVYRMENDHRLDLVGCFFNVIDERGEIIETKRPFVDPVYRLWRLQFHNNYGHGSVMMRKEAVMKVGMYDESLRYAQDFDLWSRLSAKENTDMIPSVLYSYRMVEESEQSSVRNYDSQLANAIVIGNRSLKACNPRLTEKDCSMVRALYWEFELDGVGSDGLSLVPETLMGFCERYGIRGKERVDLVRQVTGDALDAMNMSPRISEDEYPGIRNRFMTMLERVTDISDD